MTLEAPRLHASSISRTWNSRNEKLIFATLATSLFLAFASQLVYFTFTTSATVDEPVHLLAGYRHWQCGDFGINPEHPPLLKLIAAAPLMFRNVATPPWECGSKITSTPDSFLYGQKFFVQNGPDQMVIPARLASSLVAILMAVLVFAFTWRAFGKWEALIALAIVAFEPNFIANGPIVTTDMILSAAGIAAVFASYEFCRKQDLKSLLVMGISFGFLLAAKHSAILFFPALLALVIADTLFFDRSRSDLKTKGLRRIGGFAVACLMGVVLLWSLYGFRYRAIPNENVATTSVADYMASARPEVVTSFAARIVEAVERAHVLPQSYVLGLGNVVANSSRNMNLFGRAYSTGQWFYFPVSFLIKSSIALLLLFPLGIAFCIFVKDKRREMMFVLLPPLVFFGIALMSKLNIGVRHILPVYPFFIIAAAAGAVWMARKYSVFRYALIALLVYHAVTAARIAPNHVAFANDFWGGPNNTYLYFKDPNLTWGDSDKFVRDYVARNGIRDCWYAYHGLLELTEAIQPCRLLPGTFPYRGSDQVKDPVPPVIEGTVILTGMTFPPRGGQAYLPIIQSGPIDRINPSLFVYRGRFEIPLLSALSHIDRSEVLIRYKRFDEAISDAQEAVALAPADPRMHLALGLAYAAIGRNDEAKREFEEAIQYVQGNPLFRNVELRAQRELSRLNSK
jgi:hypothetical protein